MHRFELDLRGRVGRSNWYLLLPFLPEVISLWPCSSDRVVRTTNWVNSLRVVVPWRRAGFITRVATIGWSSLPPKPPRQRDAFAITSVSSASETSALPTFATTCPRTPPSLRPASGWKIANKPSGRIAKPRKLGELRIACLMSQFVNISLTATLLVFGSPAVLAQVPAHQHFAERASCPLRRVKSQGDTAGATLLGCRCPCEGASQALRSTFSPINPIVKERMSTI
jgi:hypothetical protein